MRYWTVSEARAHLPRVRQLAECIRHAAKLRKGEAASANGNRAPILLAQEALEELQAGDIVFRDAMTGLLDFHAMGADGVVYFLCWRLDEADIGFWHLPSEGFPGRKPLPRDPE